MDASYRTERIESWVGDFCHSDALGRHAATLQEYAADVLGTFLTAASAERDVDPADVEESDVRAALLGPVARLDLPASQREGVPALVASFLEELEAAGRLGGGRSLGAFVRALRPAFLEAASGKTRPIVNPAAKVGRNDPCPCGSGLKYKRCCMGRLGS